MVTEKPRKELWMLLLEEKIELLWISILEAKRVMDDKKRDRKSICMPIYSYYPFDPRVRRAASALLENGYNVDVICLRGRDEKKFDVHNGVNIYRVALQHIRGGYLRYLYNYGMFFLLSFLMLNSLDRKKNYNVVHVHSLPDFLVFISLFQRRKEKKIVLDLHEAMPEIFAARFNKNMDSMLVKVPIFLEKISIAFASHIITVNNTIKELYINRGVPEKKITVIMNSPDEKLSSTKDLRDFKMKFNLDDKFVLVYVGGINYERNLEVILHAISKINHDIPNLFFIIFGHMYGQKGQSYKESLKNLVKQLGLEDSVYIGGKVNPEEVSSYLDLSDFGIVSYIRNPLTDVAVPNKIFEYIALNKPIIVVNFKALHSLMGDDAAIYYKPEDADDLAQRIKWLFNHKNDLMGMKQNAQKVYEECKWEVMKERLLRMYENLIS